MHLGCQGTSEPHPVQARRTHTPAPPPQSAWLEIGRGTWQVGWLRWRQQKVLLKPGAYLQQLSNPQGPPPNMNWRQQLRLSWVKFSF